MAATRAMLLTVGFTAAHAAVAPQAALARTAPPPALAVSVASSGAYNISLNGALWYASPAGAAVCVGGQATPLTLAGPPGPASGVDRFGAWSGNNVTWTLPASAGGGRVVHTFKSYGAALPNVAVLTATFPDGLNTTGCGGTGDASTAFPAFDTSAGAAPRLAYVSWSGEALADTLAVTGLAAVAAQGACLDCGPVIGVDAAAPGMPALAVSALDSVKVLPQGGLRGTTSATFAMGMSAAIPQLPAGFSYSAVLVASAGGPTAATYALGAALRSWYGTRRLPSVTLDKIGYYTDDGAYYYVWSHWLPQPRPWAAEEGLLVVVRNLTARGVPISYLQIDDWWYQGAFYFGNVRSISNYTADPSPELFPNGLAAFAANLSLPLQLYAPFWADDYPTPYNMTPSTSFQGTKLVTPGDAYPFFADFFDAAAAQVAGGAGAPMPAGGGFAIFELDFLRSNYAGSASMFETTGAAAQWYAGWADAALERGIALQMCLPSATDALVSLAHPAIVQARASPDYVNLRTNAAVLGGSSLLLGACDVAPSKDTLWTASPQPPTSSDAIHTGYTTQPHVQLDVVLAVLSLGPVGISDGLGQTDVGLISQTFRSSTDGTLLRPARPLSWVDSLLLNASASGSGGCGSIGLSSTLQDVRSTHSEVPAAPGGDPDAPVLVSHIVLAWNTTETVQLQPTDLYPPPAAATPLAARQHILAPAGAAQEAGCIDGQPAEPFCAALLPPGAMPSVPATGASAQGAELAVWHVHEALPNGAFFLGELRAIVHVSPQRFQYVFVPGTEEVARRAAAGRVLPGPAGLLAGVSGSAGQNVTVWAIDPAGIVRSAVASLPASGFVEVGL